MKKLIIFMAALIAVQGAFAQKKNETRVKTKIKSAVVYLTGAEIIRSKKIVLHKGQTKLIFENISPKINTKSIRVTTDDGIDLLSISSRMNYLVKPTQLPKIKRLKDSLKIVTFKIQDITDQKEGYTTEKKMLLKNNSIGGTQNGVPISELKLAAEFFRNRIIEINKAIRSLTRETKILYESKNKITNELAELNSSSNYTRAEIEILVATNSTASKNIEVKYLVSDAGWSPAYDIKAEDIDKPVQLVYRAKVYNNTGIAWENLKMKLSTADPTLSVTQPVLNPWYLAYKTYQNYKGYGKRNSQNSLQIEQGEGYMQNMISEDIKKEEKLNSFTTNEAGLTNSNFTEAALPELNAEFEIKKPYSVPSDDKPYLIDVSKHELPATFKHYAVTKIDKDVFLLARITGWEDLNLVEGPANVYYGGTYLGQSFIKTRDVSDTLNLSLGRDGKVLVTRTKLKNFSSSQFIGSKRKETMTYELVIKNNRKSTIEIDVLDQLPISQSDEIEVKALEISDATLHPATGELKWNYKVAPGKTKKIRLSFSIKYPKNKTIEITKNKSRSVRYKF